MTPTFRRFLSFFVLLLVLFGSGARAQSLDDPTFSFTPDPPSVQVGQPLALTVGGLSARSGYTLEWGDGSTLSITGKTSQAANHSYTSVGTYKVNLRRVGSTTGTPALSQTVTVTDPPPLLNCTFTLEPDPAAVGQQVTATVTGSPPGSYTLSWGDSSSDDFSVTAGTAAPPPVKIKHAYGAAGTFPVGMRSASGSPVCASRVTITDSPVTLELTPSETDVGGVVKATVGGLVPNSSYTLDWGDGSPRENIGGASSATSSHAFESAKSYTVQVRLGAQVRANASVLVRKPTCTLEVAPEVTLGQATKVTVSGLSPSRSFTLSWGDGSSDPFSSSAVGGASLSHTFDKPGSYAIKVLNGTEPVCSGQTQVTLPIPTLEAAPSIVPLSVAVSVNAGNLLPAASYTLEYGDGQKEEISGQTKASFKHVYTSLGLKTLKLSTPGLAPVTASVAVTLPSCTVTLEPSGEALVGSPVKATVIGLPPALEVQLSWGDGSAPEAVSAGASGGFSASHTYTALLPAAVVSVKLPGVLATGVPTLCQAAPLKVGLPPVQETLTPSSDPKALIPMSFALSNLLKGEVFDYTLDYGDGESDPVTVKGEGSAALPHTYAKAGIYTARLQLKVGSSKTQRANATVNVTSPIAISKLDVNFVVPETAKALQVRQDAPLEAEVSLDYAGAGSLSGDWTLDGKLLESATYDLKKGKTSDALRLKNIPTDALGAHSLKFAVKSLEVDGVSVPLGLGLQAASSFNLSYDVTFKQDPKALNIGGFIVEISSLSNRSVTAFAGKGVHELVVGGTVAAVLTLEFMDLSVVETPVPQQVKVTKGEIDKKWDQSGLRLAKPAGFGKNRFFLREITLSPSGGKVWGAMSLYGTTPYTPPVTTTTTSGGFITSKPDYTEPLTKPQKMEPGYPAANWGEQFSYPALEQAGLEGPIYNAAPDVQQKSFGQSKPTGVPGDASLKTVPARVSQIRTGVSALKRSSSNPTRPLEYAAVPGATFKDTNYTLAQFEALGAAKFDVISAVKSDGLSAANLTVSGKLEIVLDASSLDPEFEKTGKLIFVNQTLEPQSGNLYAKGLADINTFWLGKTGLALGARPNAILDLSAAQSDPGLAATYAADVGPPNTGPGWLGIFFPKAPINTGAFSITGGSKSTQTSADFLGTSSDTGTNTALLSGVVNSGSPFSQPQGGSFSGSKYDAAQQATQAVPSVKLPGQTTTTTGEQSFDLSLDVSYRSGYNLYLEQAGGSTTIGGWAVDIEKFFIGVVKTELRLGGGKGKTQVPFLEETLPVVYTLTPEMKWNLATAKALNHNFGRSSVNTGVGVFTLDDQNIFVLRLPGAQWVNTDLIRSGDGAGATLELPNLQISASGSVTLGGNDTVSISGGENLQALGFAFPAYQLNIGQEKGAYFIGLQGKQALAENLPAVASSLKYVVNKGKNLLITVRSEGFSTTFLNNDNGNGAVMSVKGTYRELPLENSTQARYWRFLDESGGLVLADVNQKVDVPGLGSVSILDDAEKTEVGVDAEMTLGTIKAKAKALFGNRKATQTKYYYVHFVGESANTGGIRKPLFTAGPIPIYGLSGGVAYHMNWPAGGSVKAYDAPPSYDPNTSFQVVGGVVAAIADGSQLHSAGVFSISNAGFTITADAWIFTPLNDGYFGSDSP